MSPEAHDSYLRGRYFLQKREPDKSAAYFQRAISIDPSWSEAYAGLAAALASEGFFAILRPDDAITEGEAAARRAIELDPQSFWTNRNLGSALYVARHYDEALAHLHSRWGQAK